MAVTAPPRRPDDLERLLSRRRIGIWTGFAWWSGVAVVLGVPLALLGWWRPFLYLSVGSAAVAVADLVRRGWTTWRRSEVVRSGPVTRAHVTRHVRSRHKIPDLHVAALWPAGVVRGQEPPLSVRLESVAELPEGGEVHVHGELRPGAWVVLRSGDELVWPLRRVRAGLRPSHLGAYEGDVEDERDDEDDG